LAGFNPCPAKSRANALRGFLFRKPEISLWALPLNSRSDLLLSAVISLNLLFI
jgi:hypothetical protein